MPRAPECPRYFMKHYKQAPLPFIGQKRMFLNHFKAVLNTHIKDDEEDWIIVDVFGGSGLLSHVARRIKPKARVIYNDFDGYADRLKHIDDINCLRRDLLKLIADIIPKNGKISNPLKQKIINKINDFRGFIDVNLLCSWLCFSGQQANTLDSLFKKSFYNGIRQTDYESADDYLDGIEVVSESFHQLLPQFQDNPKALLILDPPYLCTNQDSYKQERYFDLIDFLRLIHLTRPPFIFFSSSKSEFIRFIEWQLDNKTLNWQAFENYRRIVVNAKLNHQVSYEDNLVYKF